MTALMGLETRLRLARLYLCTDAREREGDLPEFLSAVLAGGVDIVLIRQRGLSPDARRRALTVAQAAAARHQAVVGLGDGPARVADAPADLLHLQPGDGPAAGVRREVGPHVLLGRSAHDRREADEALTEDGLDYVCAGPVQVAGAGPVGLPAGLDLVAHLAEVAPVFSVRSRPWYAAGGVTLDTLEPLLGAGARRLCVGRAITGAADPHEAAEQFSRRLRAAWRGDPDAARYTFAATAGTGRA